MAITNKYYKKVDRSLLEWGFTIPQEYEELFLSGKKLKEGSGRKVDLLWDGKKYSVNFRHIHRTKYKNVYSLRWVHNKDFLKKLRKTFIYSYVVIKGQKESFDISKKERKYFRTSHKGGEEEVLVFTPVDDKIIKVDVFIKIESEWNKLFERLADENVFGWLFDKNKDYLISRSTDWIKVKDYQQHKEVSNVIYYLANTKKKLLYIGKANILSKRVKPGKQHQDMPGDWDLFKYDIIKPEYSNMLERIEDHTIRTIASILPNNKNYPTLGLTDYKLVNSNWKKI